MMETDDPALTLSPIGVTLIKEEKFDFDEVSFGEGRLNESHGIGIYGYEGYTKPKGAHEKYSRFFTYGRKHFFDGSARFLQF